MLGKLLIAFTEEDASLRGEDMFLRRNFAKLEQTIDDVGHLCKTDPMIVLVGRRRVPCTMGKQTVVKCQRQG